MCGIVGVWDKWGRSLEAIEAATRRLVHRGPDDFGLWRDPRHGIAFGHTRLSILDVSPAGHQPMLSSCTRYVVVLNGEIYNHLALRKRLADLAPPWRGHSDTETLLACFSAWGVEQTLKATVGMFALALWDRETSTLFLARDRMGEKPLYYGYLASKAFAFASELKALTLMGDHSADIDPGAVALLLRHNHIPSPYSIYKGLSKLAPGTWLEIKDENVQRRQLGQTRTYWSAIEVALSGVENQLRFVSDLDATSALENELLTAVGDQMVADVPLGALLSGGVDSSTIVALMQAQSARPVKTFSVGFREDKYDEATYAKAVAQHLGTEHTELYVSPTDALAVIPNLSSIYDEPFSDSSQIPTYLIARLARQSVTVALSGDGGDELFGGYSRYFLAERLRKLIADVPRWSRKPMAGLLGAVSRSTWDQLFKIASPMFPGLRQWRAPGTKMQKAASLLTASNPSDFYRRGFMSHWEPDDVVLNSTEPETAFAKPQPVMPTFHEWMMLIDSISYLPDDILVKVDRAAMAVSLETRVPLLDHRIFEFAWRLPLAYRVRGKTGKWLLREVLYRHVPRVLVDRPKKGFSVPIGAWLRGPLREWAEELINPDRLKREGFLRAEPIQQRWQEHVLGNADWQHHLWDVLMFQAWLENQGSALRP
jgi:asparagine synthase (glutamine-hydrolysing)